jgi:aryl-alcohol dehydrogenase-like predicted oxidoreductase
MMQKNDRQNIIAGSSKVRLGRSDLQVRPVGLGAMGMSQMYGPANDTESITTLRTALDIGVDFFDTADIYGAADITAGVAIRGSGHNERLIGRAIAGRRDEVVIATKFAAKLSEDQKMIMIDGRPEYVKSACEASLRRLGVETTDLYYYARIDPTVPIEDTVGAMADLVAEGKVRAIGLSEAPVEQLRRANAVHPIAALQSEWSLWERHLEDEIAAVCRELGITIVPYSPLGRAALTGTLKADASFTDDDFRASNPRYAAENLATNLEPVAALRELAESKGCTAGQLALAWLIAQPMNVVPIPGTKRTKYVQENIAATNTAISADEVAYLGQVFAPGSISGARYAPVHAGHVEASK